MQYDSDASDKVHSDTAVEDTEPKIAMRTRHSSGENSKEPARVVESKRRSFIVSRVVEHNVITDKIQEDETEGSAQVESAQSPDNPQSSIQSGSNTVNVQSQSQQSDIDASAVSDSDKSMKSVGKGKVPVNITDLSDKLTKLIGGNIGGNIGQLELAALGTNVPQLPHSVDSHSPVPSDDNTTFQQQNVPPVQQQQSASIQSGMEIPSQDQSTGQKQTQQPPAVEKPLQLPQQTQTSTTANTQQTQQGGGQQQQTSSQPLPGHSASQQTQVHPNVHQPIPNLPHPVQQQSMTQQQGPALPVQTQGSQEIPNPAMPTGMYPPGMSYFPVMQPFGYPHQHSSGMMQMYSDPMHYMNLQFSNYPNQMVPYVMVNVQQQHQIAPMLVPANMVMSNHMQFINPQSSTHPQHIHKEGHGGESQAATPPSTPPHARKHFSDSQSEPGVPLSEVQSPAAPRGNYSLASLEQDLIKKLHGGTRKDIPISSAGAQLNDSFTQGSTDLRFHEDKPAWALSSESLHSANSEVTDHVLSKVDEAARVEDQKDTATTDTKVEEETETPQDKVVITKKLRFQVSRVEDDPIKQTDSFDSQGDDKIDGELINEQADLNRSKNDTETTNVFDENNEDKKPAKLGRFSVTKVADKHVSNNESDDYFETQTTDEYDGKDVDHKFSKITDEESNQASADIQHDQDMSVSKLHDLPYRKKSMSFFEGKDSPVLSNNTCDSFYNTHMDRFQIFSRRRTKSLSSLPIQARLSLSSQSISMQTQCTQYGDGETPSPSPSPIDVERGFPNVVFDLLSSRDDGESSSCDSESKDGRESGIDSEPREQIIRRPPLRRQSRKVSRRNHACDLPGWFKAFNCISMTA